MRDFHRNPNLARLLSLSIMSLTMACAPQTGETSNRSAIGVEADENGVSTTNYDPNASSQTVFEVTGDSAVTGTSLQIPPGSLTVATELSIEQGESFDLGETLAEVEVDSEGASSAGPAVVISPSEVADASEPMTIAIPLEGSSLALTERNLVILFLVEKASAEGDTFLGVIPTSSITLADGSAQFETKHFGVFQAVYVAKAVTEKREVKSSRPFVRTYKSKDFIGIWELECGAHDRGRSKRERFTYSDRRLFLKMLEFDDSECNELKLDLRLGFTTKFENKGDGLFHLEATAKVFYLAPISEEQADHFNGEESCGITDWKKGVPRSINFECLDSGGDGSSGGDSADEECRDGPPGLGGTIYSQIKVVDKNTLHTPGGECDPNADGSTAEKRESLTEFRIFKRITN